VPNAIKKYRLKKLEFLNLESIYILPPINVEAYTKNHKMRYRMQLQNLLLLMQSKTTFTM